MFNPKPKIFISAVSRELGSARQLVANTLQALGYEPTWQDIFGTEQGNLYGMLRRRIKECDGVIQLVGRRYGFEPAVPDRKIGRVSYTQYETIYAREIGKKVWYLRVDDQFPADPCPPESVELRQLQSDYAARVMKGDVIYHNVASLDGLALSVHRIRDDLNKLRTAARRWSMGVSAALLAILSLVIWLVVRPDGLSWLKSTLAPMAMETHDIRSIVGTTSDEVHSQSAKLDDVAVGVKDTKKEVSSDPRKELQNLGIPSTAEAFEASSRSGDLRALALFLQAGFSPNQTINGLFPLNFTFFERAPDESAVIDLFLKNGLNFKAVGPDQTNSMQPGLITENMEHQVLHTAVRHHDAPGLQALLKAGADPTALIQEWRKKLISEHDFSIKQAQQPETYGRMSNFFSRDLELLNYLEKAAGKPLTKFAVDQAAADAAAAKDKQDAIDTDIDAKMFARVAAGRRGAANNSANPTNGSVSLANTAASAASADARAGVAAYTNQDYTTAARLFQSSAAAGNTLAMIRLGAMYEVGLVVQKDPSHGYQLFKQAADVGDTNGFYAMGFATETGQGVERDHAAAIALMKKAAAGGSRNATIWLQQHGT